MKFSFPFFLLLFVFAGFGCQPKPLTEEEQIAIEAKKPFQAVDQKGQTLTLSSDYDQEGFTTVESKDLSLAFRYDPKVFVIGSPGVDLNKTSEKRLQMEGAFVGFMNKKDFQSGVTEDVYQGWIRAVYLETGSYQIVESFFGKSIQTKEEVTMGGRTGMKYQLEGEDGVHFVFPLSGQSAVEVASFGTDKNFEQVMESIQFADFE